MSLYNFSTNQEFTSIDQFADFRTENEKQFTPLSVFNHDNPALAFAEKKAEEIINISGAWLTIFPRTNNSGTADEVWEEDGDPTYKSGVKLKGYFVPQPVNIELTRWGIDSQNKTSVIFARAIVFGRFGERMLRPGDVFEIPHNTLTPLQVAEPGGKSNRMDKFRVLNASDIGNFLYRWLYWKCDVEALTGDITIQVDHR